MPVLYFTIEKCSVHFLNQKVDLAVNFSLTFFDF
jgi:hypothetical protein